MVIEDQFRLMVKRHEGLIRSVCVGFSRGDMELCGDLMQEAVTGMWLRFKHREARMFAAAQGVWVYWQTHHFASQALRRWKTGSMTPGEVPETGGGRERRGDAGRGTGGRPADGVSEVGKS